MNVETIRLLLMIGNMLITAGVWFYVRSDRHNKEMLDSIKTLETNVSKKMELKCRRISQLEIDLKAHPTKDEIVRIHERLDSTANDSRHMILMMGEISGQIKQMNMEQKPLFRRWFH